MTFLHRNDKMLTPTVVVQPSLRVFRLPILPNMLGTFGLNTIEGDLLDSIIAPLHCEVAYPQKYHECEHHAVFLKWSKLQP